MIGAPVYIHFTLLNVPLNKYASDIPHVCSPCAPIAVYIQNLQNAHIFEKEPRKCNFIYHAIAIYVLATNIHFKCHMSNVLITQCVSIGKYVNIYMPHKMSL